MLKGRTAVITGASRGIGAAIALKFAELGANAALLYKSNSEKAEEVRKSAEAFGTQVKIYRCDVASSEDCRNAVAEITKDFGKIDILVNNAGITKDNLLAMMPEEDFAEVVNTNLVGCFNMMKACTRSFIRNKYGKIINVSSVSALIGLAGQCNYAASKAGIIAMTKSAARELASRNVCVNAIAPGFISTDMTKELDSEGILTKIPLKRLGAPEDVANLAAFLASGASDYITGETIRIDGGLAI